MDRLVPQEGKIVEAITPQAGAAITGDFVSLKNYDKCLILVHINHAAANAVTITVDGATDVAAGGLSAGITFTDWWINEDCAASDTLVKGAAAAASIVGGAALTHHMYAIEIDGSELNALGLDCIRVVTSASAAANITSAMYILHGARYQQSTPPSAIVD